MCCCAGRTLGPFATEQPSPGGQDSVPHSVCPPRCPVLCPLRLGCVCLSACLYRVFGVPNKAALTHSCEAVSALGAGAVAGAVISRWVPVPLPVPPGRCPCPSRMPGPAGPIGPRSHMPGGGGAAAPPSTAPCVPPSAGLSAASGRDRTMSTLKVYSTSVTGSREVSSGVSVPGGGCLRSVQQQSLPRPPRARCPLPCSRCAVPICPQTHPPGCAEPGWHAGCVPALGAPLHLPITCFSHPASRSNPNRAK